MQLSHYVKIYPWEEDLNKLVFFSTKTATVMLLKSNILKSIEDGNLSESEKKMLLRKNIITTDRKAEMKEIVEFIELNSTKENRTLELSVLMNSNKKTESDSSSNGSFTSMSERTADDLINYLKNNFSIHKKYIYIKYYGVENYSNIALIKQISTHMSDFAEKRDACYRFSVSTSVLLLSGSNVHELVALGLDNISVTFESPAAFYEQNSPTELNTLKNIYEMCEMVTTCIVVKYAREDLEKRAPLVDYMKTNGLGPSKVSRVIFVPKLNSDNKIIVDYNKECMIPSQSWNLNDDIVLREKIMKHGYYIPETGPETCMIESSGSYAVDYDGGLYKCPAFAGKPAFVIGNIADTVTDYSQIYRVGFWKNSECLDCIYLPICLGGCRFKSYLENKPINTKDCRKEYFEKHLEILLMQDNQLRIKTGQYLQLKAPDNTNMDFEALCERLDRTIERFFPNQLLLYNRPELEDMIICYRNAYHAIHTCLYDKQNDDKSKDPPIIPAAFFTVSAVRYIDNFIDEALWPALANFDPSLLPGRFDKFLLELLETLRLFDPDVTEELTMLPKTELYLALNPTQDNFDGNFEKLFKYKSYDLYYYYEKMLGRQITAAESEKLNRIAFVEYLQNFSQESIASDTDFNIYKHIRDNGLNPHKFMEYLISICRHEFLACFAQAQKDGILSGLDSDITKILIEEEKMKPSTPFDLILSSTFARTIHLLKKLQS